MDEFLIDEAQAEGENAEILLATVTAVNSDGVQIQIDGESAPGEKYYKCNTAIRFQTGQRVRIKPDSGTYIVEFAVGDPMDNYPIPAGGATGQVLTKTGAASYAIGWAASHGLPSGGSSGQILAKSSNTDYEVGWIDAPHGIPSGGSTNQVLTKSSNTDYAVMWAAAPSPTGLANGSKSITLGSTGYLTQSGNVEIGSSGSPFAGLAINGQIRLGTTAYSTTLGFFGTNPVSRQTVSSTATVATLITALKAYGLIA